MNDINTFLEKKRVSVSEKEEWAQKVISYAVALVEKEGRLTEVSGLDKKPLIAEISGLKLIYTTPFTQAEKLPGMQYDYFLVIYAGRDKVFSASWEPTDIHLFKKGEWMNTLFEQKVEIRKMSNPLPVKKVLKGDPAKSSDLLYLYKDIKKGIE